MQNALAVMGITTQSCRSSYDRYQSQMFPAIISKAKESAKQALNAVIAHANTKEKKPLLSGLIVLNLTLAMQDKLVENLFTWIILKVKLQINLNNY